MSDKMWDQVTDTVAKFLVNAPQQDLDILDKIGQTLAAKGMKFQADVTTGKMTVMDPNIIEKQDKGQAQSR